ncbi:Hypothetical predicted protein [Lecanosticta acicola]|uniref:Uncharacterized protein n=1 Tax=Lecanosticta acicola TaxID=111012 RepID=A0AAI9EAV9_9PEZI|nr:Hypothetical predicted protein [Lecanosticta acicola]
MTARSVPSRSLAENDQRMELGRVSLNSGCSVRTVSDNTHIHIPQLYHVSSPPTNMTTITDPTLLSVLQAATAARDQCLSLISLLETNTPTETTTTTSTEETERALSARLAILRALNRKAIYSVRETKQQTAAKRHEVDELHLQLQNITHKYTTLPMLPAEDFLARNPAFLGRPEHDVTLARIRDEHEARQALEAERVALVRKKEGLVRETNAKKEELGRLDVEVERWIAGQEGVRRVFEARGSKGEGKEVEG